MSEPNHGTDEVPTGQAFLDRFYTPSLAEMRPAVMAMTTTGTHRAICPDLLSIRDIGEADGWRGRVIRGFFRVMRAVTGL